MRILVTTTSFQDTPGSHHDLLSVHGWEIAYARGPLSADEIAKLVVGIDGLICGDDAITAKVLEAATDLKVISKYGIGVDKIDIGAAAARGIPVCYTPGVNHTTVSEHVFALLLALSRNLVDEANDTREGRWTRLTGHEIAGKTIGIVGLGRIGREVATRAIAFGLTVVATDTYWPEAFATKHGIRRSETLDELLRVSDIVTLHTNLTEETRGMIDTKAIEAMKSEAILINCARGELVVTDAVVAALASEQIGAYGTDVLDEEPPRADHPLLSAPRTIVTPHIGSRTYESVVRQATMSVENLTRALNGDEPLAQISVH